MVLCLQSCRKDLEPVPPQVYTEPVSDISETSACFHGIAKGIGAIPEVYTKGFHISTNKDFSDAKEVGRSTGEGSYMGYINSLLPGKTYYVRAYASNWVGDAYGKTIDFTTLSHLEEPNITTIANVTDTSVVITGTWFSDNDNGFWYSYSRTPSTGSSIHVSDNAGTYSATLTNLQPNTTYSVRAYTSDGSQISYSDVSQFTTLAATNTPTTDTTQTITPPTENFQPIKDGCIMFPFSVSDSTQVYFSQGNLQYQASTKTWRFAEHQYNYIGDDNSNISDYYTGWIDLFGWGTSGWNSGAKAYQPYDTSTNRFDYEPGNKNYNSLTGAYAKADWGVYNAISNGGNTAGIWRVLTAQEVGYLLTQRTGATNKYGVAQVAGVNGCILLPDNWKLPEGLRFTSGTNVENSYTDDEWACMETAGAVFLPEAGWREKTDIYGINTRGFYWSTFPNPAGTGPYVIYIKSDWVNIGTQLRGNGCSVRLVRDVTKK